MPDESKVLYQPLAPPQPYPPINRPPQLCQAIIWLDSDAKANTYCMLNRGHTGEHSPEREVRNPK